MLEDRRSFPLWLANREDFCADPSIVSIREKICENAWNVDQLCYVHDAEECRSCDSMPRPSCDKCQRHIAECSPSESEQLWARKYELSLYERRVALMRGASRWRHRSQQRNMSPVDTQCRAMTRSPARPLSRLTTRYSSRGRGDNQSPRHSRSRHRSRS